MQATETVYLQPNTWTPGGCNGTVAWNLTAGDNGTEIRRLDNYCGGIALSQDSYRDFEFKGKFSALDADDDWIGFFFGYEDSEHFYLLLASGDWDTHVHNENDVWRVVRVDSVTGTASINMTSAIISGVDVPGQTKVIQRSSEKGWAKGSSYSWTLTYKPSLKSATITIEKDSEQLLSFDWDKTFDEPRRIGRVGVYAYSQPSRFYDLSVKTLCLL